MNAPNPVWDRGVHLVSASSWRSSFDQLLESEIAVPDALESVKSLAAEFHRLAKEAQEEKPAMAKRHEARAEALESVAAELGVARKRLRPISVDHGDLSDLPDEVMAQLNLAKIDELEQQLRDIVASGSGTEVPLDTIIIELYRRHKVIQERRFVMNKLYRMAQKGLINSVEGKKGAYYLTKPWDASSWDAPTQSGFDLDADIPF